jgi:CRP-like cAMP-binding protein
MDKKFWYLKDCSLFQCLTEEQVRRLESRAKSREFKRGTLIYAPSDLGDCVLVLTSGRVKIFHNTQDGKQAVLALIDPGELFGELALVEHGQREEYAESMEVSTVVVIPSEEIQRLMDEHPKLSLGLEQALGSARATVQSAAEVAALPLEPRAGRTPALRLGREVREIRERWVDRDGHSALAPGAGEHHWQYPGDSHPGPGRATGRGGHLGQPQRNYSARGWPVGG